MKHAAKRFFRGQNLVEFALTIPFILVFFMVIAEVGRAWFFYEAIKMAASDGAHTAAIYQNPQVGLQATQRRLSSAGIETSAGNLQVSQVPGQHAYQVTVRANFVPLFGAANFGMIGVDLFEGFPITYTALKQATVY